MSYDLFFRPRSSEIDEEAFEQYFLSRPHYKVDLPQAWYQNEDTGVYFVFELKLEHEADADEDDTSPVSLNINYFRPSYFILEAEPEVTAFVHAFDMTVSDPQMHGMGEREYNPALLKSGWNHGNDFGYSAILREPQNRSTVFSLPAAALMKAWSWNLGRHQLQNKLGDNVFVPRVLFVNIEGQAVTTAVWPDGIPIAVPEVDILLVPRKELAPRRFLRRVEDRALVSLNDARTVLEQHGKRRTGDILVLDYSSPPGEIVKYVQSLPADTRDIQGLAADQVLDREIVEKHSS